MKKKIVIIVLSIIAVLLIGVIAWWNIVRAIGKNKIINSVESNTPIIETQETLEMSDEEKATWKEGWVKYNGKIYEYDEDLITFLVMGIDKDSEVEEVAEGTNGGQADALFLLVLDKNEEKIDIIGVNRNTMADVDVYNDTGSYVGTTKAQIAVQHGFGNGVEESCEYQVEAVRRLMYNLPIHGYVAINMKAIPIINDTVGGVNVDVEEDIINYFGELHIKGGQQVHLMGDDAYYYIHDRNGEEFGSADKRLARQKQYLSLFFDQAKATIKDNPGVVAQLYKDITPYMVTSLSFDEIAYLAPEVAGYELDINGIRTFEGETVKGEIYEEFYPDENALYDLIIKIFYNEIQKN